MNNKNIKIVTLFKYKFQYNVKNFQSSKRNVRNLIIASKGLWMVNISNIFVGREASQMALPLTEFYLTYNRS